MHDIVMEQFEEHLSGNASRAFYDHLDACTTCRAEVESMSNISGLIRELRADPEMAPQPSLGFYKRVTYRVIDTQRQEAWGLFSPGAAFFRRVAFASLLILATLGSFLVSHESGADGADAVTIMAQHDVTVEHSASSDRERSLVTLASYH